MEQWFSFVLGRLFIALAFLTKGIRGGLNSSGSFLPISRTGRILLFLMGVVVLINGMNGMRLVFRF
jgi:hypothetical protein